MFRSLASRIFTLHVIFVIFPLLVYFLIFFDWEYKEKIITDIYRLRDIGLSRASNLEKLIQDRYTILDTVENFSQLNVIDVIEDKNKLLNNLKRAGQHTNINFLKKNASGDFVVYYDSSLHEKVGTNLTYRGYVASALHNGYAVYLGYDVATLNKDFLFAKTIRNRDNYSVLGILLTWTSADPLLQVLMQDKYFKIGQRISLLTNQKIVFASSDKNFVFRGFAELSQEQIDDLSVNKQFGPYKVPQEVVKAHPFTGIKNVLEWTEGREKHIAFMAPVAKGSLYILVDIPQKVIAQPYIKATWLTISVLLGIILLSCLITILVGGLLTKTLHGLIALAHQVGQGDLQARFQRVRFGFELNKVGDILNAMLDRLLVQTKAAELELTKTAAISKELKIGSEMQQSILPQIIPEVPGLEIGVLSQPAREVNGDFYDFYFANEQFMIMLASTSGKGFSACLYSASLRSMLKSFSTVCDNVGAILEKANSLLYRDLQDAPLFIKTFLGVWVPEQSTLRYASATLAFGFVRTVDGQIYPLASSRSNIGTQSNLTFEMYSLPIPEGSIVVLYTGGAIDQQNPENEMYGENRLIALVQKNFFLPAKELASEIENSLRHFSQEKVQENDITVVVLKVKHSSQHV